MALGISPDQHSPRHLHDAAEVLELRREHRLQQVSRSGVLAVQLLRDQLELAVGSAVRSSGDAGLLVRWLSTDMGAADFAAVEALGRLVGRGDPRYLAFLASCGG
jgi:hypothetical protein